MSISETKKTDRGFAYLDFSDLSGMACTIQESSSATRIAIWIGAEKNMMHLDQNGAKWLSTVLAHFAAEGKLPGWYEP